MSTTNFQARPERTVKQLLIGFRLFASNRAFYVFGILSCLPMHGDVSCTGLNDASGVTLMNGFQNDVTRDKVI